MYSVARHNVYLFLQILNDWSVLCDVEVNIDHISGKLCVCVHVREREGEGEREKKGGWEGTLEMVFQLKMETAIGFPEYTPSVYVHKSTFKMILSVAIKALFK